MKHVWSNLDTGRSNTVYLTDLPEYPPKTREYELSGVKEKISWMREEVDQFQAH